MGKKMMAALAVSLALAMPMGQAAGGVNGFIKLSPELHFTAMGSGSTHNGERGPAVGIGFSVGGENGERSVRGAKIQLISQEMDVKALTAEEIGNWYQKGIVPAERPIFLTETEENGAYEIGDVPAGHYYLIVIAGQMEDGGADPLRTRSGEALAKYLPRWDEYVMFVIGMNRYTVQEVEVKDGVMTRADYDFGKILGK